MQKNFKKLMAFALLAVMTFGFMNIPAYTEGKEKSEALTETTTKDSGTNEIRLLANNAGDFYVTSDTGTGYSYNDKIISITESGTYTITGDGSVHSGYQISIAGYITVELTLSDVMISNSSAAAMNITNTATVTLYLEGSNSFSSGSNCAGIQFQGASTTSGGSLTITSNSDGSLTATGGDNGAGIGGGRSGAGNYITINGGAVTATGGDDGAGIGGGYEGSGSNITITGGTVIATGGMHYVDNKIYAAGIGGGFGASGSNITISGGTVTASGGDYGAGIGGGDSGSGSNITISGGTVTATGGYGAGIGGGRYGSGSNITISGGTVTATGGTNAADIGSGYNGGSSSDIVISGGSVKATNESISGTPTDGDANDPQNVYLCTISDISGVDEVTVDSGTYTRNGDHGSDGAFYLYLTGKDHEIMANGTKYRAVWNSSSNSFTLKTYTETPNATFSATGEDSGTLSGVDTTMAYSVDGGDTWTDITGTAMDITGVTEEKGIKIYRPETDSSLASEYQTISVTKATTPTVSSTNCTTSEQNDGKITGVDTTMEYRLSTDSEWTSITDSMLTDSTLTGLTYGTYYVRVKASGTQLASTTVEVSIYAHSCVAQSDWQHDDDTHWKNCTSYTCGAKLEEAPHAGGTATCTQKADCTTCGEAYGSALDHDFSGDFDAYDEYGHWHICNRVGCTETDEKQDHSFTNYTYNDDATCTEDGTETAKCDYCDATDTITDSDNPATGHTWSEPTWEWNTDYSVATATFACQNNSSHTGQVTATAPDETITKAFIAATCTEDGKITYTATVTFNNTSYSTEITVTDASNPATDHSWDSAWSSDENYHWHECIVDGCTLTDNSKKGGYAEHDYTQKVVSDAYKVSVVTYKVRTFTLSTASGESSELYYYSCECGQPGTETFAYSSSEEEPTGSESTSGGSQTEGSGSSSSEEGTTGSGSTSGENQTEGSGSTGSEEEITGSGSSSGEGQTEESGSTGSEEETTGSGSASGDGQTEASESETTSTETAPDSATTTDDGENTSIETTTDADTSSGEEQTGDMISAQTGDNSYIASWIILLLAVCAGVTGTFIYNYKRKYSK